MLFEETLKTIFNKALREGLITFNPVHSLRMYSENACAQINLQDLFEHRLFHVESVK
ncbi:hypothetical protein HMPREF9135_1341 [Segatella baroniae F0067]|uniref:Uncharacterized protein n=1 Tax=Segatella baroniae F0067 TaxID=1115809 RepID=U2NR55_9BACT|nr:hypothetical protein HMPREF9135_1341 [Segatella baroniae F0067]